MRRLMFVAALAGVLVPLASAQAWLRIGIAVPIGPYPYYAPYYRPYYYYPYPAAVVVQPAPVVVQQPPVVVQPAPAGTAQPAPAQTFVPPPPSALGPPPTPVPAGRP
jgi:hypothetical protein